MNGSRTPSETDATVLSHLHPDISLKLRDGKLTAWVAPELRGWVAIITGPSQKYNLERKFIAQNKYGNDPDKGTRRLYQSYPVEIVVEKDGRRVAEEYYQYEDGELQEISKEKVESAMARDAQ